VQFLCPHLDGHLDGSLDSRHLVCLVILRSVVCLSGGEVYTVWRPGIRFEDLATFDPSRKTDNEKKEQLPFLLVI